MERTEGYECLVLMTPVGLHKDLVERAEAHGNSLAMEVLLMLERDVGIAKGGPLSAVGTGNYTAQPVDDGGGDEVRG